LKSKDALNMYYAHGILSLTVAKKLLGSNSKARLTGYCSSSDTWVGPYYYAIIDLCDLQATVHAYDPDQVLEKIYGCCEEV